MSKISNRLRSYLSVSNAIACVALFAALGTGAAFGLPGKGSVDKNDIRAGAVSTKQVKDEALSGADVGQLTGADVNDATLGGAELQNDAVGAAQLAPNSVGSSELSDDSVGTSEIADDAVTGAAFFRATTVSINPPSISAEAGDNCTSVSATVSGVVPGDHVFASPESLDAGLVMFALPDTNQVNLRVCNLGQNTVDEGAIDVFLLVIR